VGHGSNIVASIAKAREIKSHRVRKYTTIGQQVLRFRKTLCLCFKPSTQAWGIQTVQFRIGSLQTVKTPAHGGLSDQRTKDVNRVRRMPHVLSYRLFIAGCARLKIQWKWQMVLRLLEFEIRKRMWFSYRSFFLSCYTTWQLTCPTALYCLGKMTRTLLTR